MGKWLGRIRRSSLALLVYVQLGYPALIVVLARLRRRDGERRDIPLPKVTVVIAAWNEEAAIEGKLRNTFSSDYPPELLEVVVAADGSTDRTVERTRGLGDERVIISNAPDRAGKVAALNRSCALATGDVVVLSDANNFYRPDTIRRLVEPFADPSVGAVSGSKMTSSGPSDLQLGESLYWRYEKLIKECESSLGSCTSASGEILAVRRELLEPLPVDIGLDDFVRLLDILKKGLKVAFASGAISIEPTSASLSDERVRRERITAARWRLLAHPTRFPLHRPLVMWQIASHKLGRLFLPLFALAALVANLGEVVFDRRRGSRAPATVLMAQAAFYAAGAVGPHLGLSGHADSLARLPRYLITTNVATLRGLVTAMQGRSTANWTRVERYEEASG